MKHFTVVLVLALAFILTSCSQFENNSYSPVAPSFEKSNINVEPTVYPFNYLDQFTQCKVIRWDMMKNNQGIKIVMGEVSKTAKYFAVLEFANIGGISQNGKVLVYLNNPGSNQFVISAFGDQKVVSVRVFCYSNQIGIVPNGNTYNTLQSFLSLQVVNWTKNGKEINVNSTNWVPNLTQVYAEIQLQRYSVIVFLQRPATSSFSIPEFGDKAVKNVSLFGLYNSQIGIPNKKF